MRLTQRTGGPPDAGDSVSGAGAGVRPAGERADRDEPGPAASAVDAAERALAGEPRGGDPGAERAGAGAGSGAAGVGGAGAGALDERRGAGELAGGGGGGRPLAGA